MFRFFENLVDPYIDYREDDRPPTRLGPFLMEYARPFRAVFVATAVFSILVAAVELWLIYYLGRVVDVLGTTGPAQAWDAFGTELLLVAAFILIARPLLQLVDVGLLNNAILPNFGTLIRWRSHRHVLRQSVG